MEKIKTTAVIDEIREEYKYVTYVVRAKFNGETVKAESIPYSKKRKLLPIGTNVDVNYWQSPKGISKNVEILNTKQLPLSQVEGSVFATVFMGSLDLILFLMIIEKIICKIY